VGVIQSAITRETELNNYIKFAIFVGADVVYWDSKSVQITGSADQRQVRFIDVTLHTSRTVGYEYSFSHEILCYLLLSICTFLHLHHVMPLSMCRWSLAVSRISEIA
jgi:hypothetical protein